MSYPRFTSRYHHFACLHPRRGRRRRHFILFLIFLIIKNQQ